MFNKNHILSLIERAQQIKKWNTHEWVFTKIEIDDIGSPKGDTAEFLLECHLEGCYQKVSGEWEAVSLPTQDFDWLLGEAEICLGRK